MSADIEAQRARNRAEFPAIAAIMDECRAAFGADVKLAYAVERGRAVGKPVDNAGLVRCSHLAPLSDVGKRHRAAALKAFVLRFRRQPRLTGDGEWAEFYSGFPPLGQGT